MVESTKELLVSAAARLLDAGGQTAVTLRAVAEQVGVSHNAPYRHFSDRSALLAAVAERDFLWLKKAFENRDRASPGDAGAGLRACIRELIGYARQRQARYRLLFSDPGLVPSESLKAAALGSFQAFSHVVSRCQDGGLLPRIDTVRLAGLIYATTHGAIDLELGGRSNGQKGLASIEATVDLLLELLAKPQGSTR